MTMKDYKVIEELPKIDGRYNCDIVEKTNASGVSVRLLHIHWTAKSGYQIGTMLNEEQAMELVNRIYIFTTKINS